MREFDADHDSSVDVRPSKYTVFITDPFWLSVSVAYARYSLGALPHNEFRQARRTV